MVTWGLPEKENVQKSFIHCARGPLAMNPLPDPAVNAGKVTVAGLATGQVAGAGRFLLQRVIGQGGMGVVWLAHDRLLREDVALKFLPPQIAFDPAALLGLRREALSARKLSHPNLVRIHDLIDAPDEPPFLCMEYVDGPTLHALRSQQPHQVLSWEFLEPLVRQLCSGLAYAHGERTIHRDIKPANLMLTAEGRLKLADFGLARVISDSMSRLSEQTHTSGTLGYMSPQQADGERPSATDDLYSVGATLYELLTSTPPFTGGDIGYQVRHREPVALSARLAELEIQNPIPANVEAAIMACLAKAGAQRPQSATNFLARLATDGSHDRLGPGTNPATPRTAVARTVGRAKIVGFSAAALAIVVGAAVAWYLLRDPLDGRDAAVLPPTSPSFATMAPTSSRPATEDGFEILFNGRDLAGWDGDTNFWHVRDGAITAITSEEGIARRVNTCLIWREPVDDFELRLKFRLLDVITAKPANSGVLYRARRLEDWRVQGYQCDLHGPQAGTLLLLWDTLSDPRSELGRSSVLQELHGKTIFRAAAPADNRAAISRLTTPLLKDEWNDLTIIAQGKQLLHELNGVRTAEVRDERPAAQSLSGCLAIELKRATQLQFKDIRLKRLSADAQGAGR